MTFNELMAKSLDKFYSIKIEYKALPFLILVFLFILHLRYFSYIFMVLAAIIGVLLFITFVKREKKKEEIEVFEPLEIRNRSVVKYVLNILFFVFYGLSFLALLQGFYTKTIWYYIFISLCAGLVATEILIVKTKTEGTINLIKTFLLGLNVFLSNQIVFPFGIGMPDAGYHIREMILPIVKTGYIPPDSSYSSFPGHHILAAMNSLIMSVDPGMMYFYLGGIVMSAGILFVFLLGRKFIGLRVGLLAALIYTGCDRLIVFASHPCQMSFTLPLGIMIIAIILYMCPTGKPGFGVLFPILVTSLIFTHHYSPMVVSIVIVSILIAEIVQHIKSPSQSWKIPTLFLLFIIILFSHWMYISNMFGGFVGIIQAYNTAFSSETSIMTPMIYDTLPIKTIFLNTLGSNVLMMLSVMGFLYFFRCASFFKNVVMISSITILLLVSVGIVINEVFLLPQRLYPFLQELGLVFLASTAILHLFKSDGAKYIKPFIAVTLIVCFVFFSSASTISGFETSPFVGNQAYDKMYRTPHESYSEQWVEAHISNNSTAYKSTELPLTGESSIDHQNITEDSWIVFSKFYFKAGLPSRRVPGTGHHFGGETRIKFDEEELYLLDEYNQYYDNGMVDLYYTMSSRIRG